MRELPHMLLIGSVVLLAGSAAAQERGERPCFDAATAFDRALDPDAPANRLERATALRNEGMTACNAGRIADGIALIERATAALGDTSLDAPGAESARELSAAELRRVRWRPAPAPAPASADGPIDVR